MTEPLSPTVVALLRPGVLRRVGGRMDVMLAEDAPLREKRRHERAGQ